MCGKRWPAVAGVGLALLASFARTADLDRLGRAAVDHFLEQRQATLDPGETAILQAAALADFGRDGQPAIALVWTTLGPTYWRNTLTVLAHRDGRYREVANAPLDGEAQLASANTDGTLVVELKTYAAQDPRCCPSLLQLRRYHYANGTLTPAGGSDD